MSGIHTARSGDGEESHRLLATAGLIALLAALYVLTARLGLALSVVGQSVTLIWPPSGLSLAALLIFGYRLWPGVALGAFIVNALTDVPLLTAAGMAAGNTLEALTGAYLLNRIVGAPFSLDRVRHVFALIVLAAAGSTAVSATFGVASLCLGEVVPWTRFAPVWLVWWMGDAMGDLVFAPLLLVWGRKEAMQWSLLKAIEAGLLLVSLTLLGELIFGSGLTAWFGDRPRVFTTFPLIVWAALRFGPRGAALSTLLLTLLALWGTLGGSGPFSGRTVIESHVLLWLYANVMAVTGLVLAASLRERRAAEADTQLAAKVFENTAEAIVITDAETRILSVNRAFSELTGYTAAEVLGNKPSLLSSGRHDEQFYQNMWAAIDAFGHWQGEVWDRRRDGDVFPCWLVINSVRTPTGRISHYIAIYSDISERKQVEAQMHHLAQHDALTGLANRLLLEDRIEQALLQAARHAHQVALLFIDLDRFKVINDTLGHAVGDELLEAVARRLQGCVRAEDTVARQGGDEFVIALPDIAHPEDAAQVAQQVIAAMNGAFQVREYELHVAPSVGIGIYPSDGSDAQTLMKNADTAMYDAKHAGGNTYRFYAARMNESAYERLVMENGLRRAIERDEFVLHYQPQVELATGRLVGVEALLRWQHPDHGLIAPGTFIPLAEETGLIVPIGEWVLREACRQCNAWRESGGAVLRIAVNISARQFWRGNLLETLDRVLQETGAPADLLEVELTESVLMRHEAETVALLEHLSKLGIMISIDDFGTGFSSLGYLKRFPIDKLKIDQSFVADIRSGADDAAIASAVIALARGLDLRVIAEGVETQLQLDVLKALGCEEAQGYFIGRPVPAAALSGIIVAGKLW